MTIISQIEDRGAVVAWSPLATAADVIAVGTKDSGGVGFDDYGGELELYDTSITNRNNVHNNDTNTTDHPKPSVIGSVKTTSRFSSIGWTPCGANVSERFEMGLLAGGMTDGTVNIWNPAAISSSSPLLSTISRHSNGAVSALQFNPHPSSANLLATGGSNGEVLITSLETPETPTVTIPSPDHTSQGAEITQVAWNTQVEHIVASSAGNGTVVVWDLRQQKPWCELRCESAGLPLSDICWNPSQGLHLVTASSDDRNPLLKLWDLRSSTTVPLATMQGHNQGILSLAWCPHDDSLLLSCGKDNQTFLWDLYSMKPIANIPNTDTHHETKSNHNTPNIPNTQDPSYPNTNTNQLADPAANLYGGGLTSSQQRRYDVQWSPLRRGVISTCSFDRKIQTHSVIGLATKSGRTPKWMKPASGVSFGMGGTLLTFGSNNKHISLTTYVEKPDLHAASTSFETSMATQNIIQYCSSKAAQAANHGNLDESQIWGFMQILFNDNHAREQLLHFLDFDSNAIRNAALEYDITSTTNDVSSKLSIHDDNGNGNKEDKPSSTILSKEAEDIIQRALMVGDFEAAVQCCFANGNKADALVLASCGGANLWAKTQARYFEAESTKRPYLSIVNAVVHKKLLEYVAASDPASWHNTLAVLCTYGESEEFPILCHALGDRLENVNDISNASLCYMCASNLDKASQYWKIQLEEAYKANDGPDFLALHSFVEKVAVFMKSMDANYEPPDVIKELLFTYANALADQGLYETAAKYCSSNSQASKELRDRLYRSKYSQTCTAIFGSSPEFPYQYVNVGVAPLKPTVTNKQSSSTSSKTQQTYNNASQNVQQPASYNNNTNTQTYTTNYDTKEQYKQNQNSNNFDTQNTNELPPGWISLQDPASGRTYYAHEQSGETTWDKPSLPEMAVQPATTLQSSANGSSSNYSSQQQQTYSQQPSSNISTNRTPSKLASKYGDGFVTSASHPELAEQYGNVGTSNPYSDSRPGTAVVNKLEKPPVSGTYDPKKLSELGDEFKPITEGLLSYTSYLSGLQLVGSEKKQLAESEKGVAVLVKRLGRRDVDANTISIVSHIVDAMNKKDFSAASRMQTDLVNSDWKEHKDWLKGLKFLIQLALKKS